MAGDNDVRAFHVLGVIPARGGSKSIPKKNVVDLCGKPLIAYTIEAALGAKLIDCCIVSTDCEEIASVAKACGAEVPFIRPAVLSSDNAGSLGVVLHALECMEHQNNTVYDAVVMLQPTTPFRKATLIDEALRRLATSHLDSVVSLVDVGANHPYRMYSLDQKNELISFVEGVVDPMMARQKLPAVYIRSGDIYATRRRCLVEQKSLIGRHSGGLVIDPEYAVNIDEPIDLEMARLKLRGLSGA
jgi:CMP-N,N'-diacetyllegionaminic acid synthase